MDIHLIIGILITLVLSAFFSGMEIAFVASNRMLAEMEKDKNGIAQHCIQVFYRNPNGFVSTMLVGNNIVLVLYGILFADLFNQTLFAAFSSATQVMLDTVCSTVIVLFTGEFLPKTFFKSNPNRLLTFFAPIAYLFFIVLWPISRFSTFLSRCFLRMGGVTFSEKENDGTFTKVDLDYLVQASIDNAGDEEEIDEDVKIFQNALEFTETRVKDCMIPRTEINAVEENCSAEELQQMFIESGNSKIIVYKDDIDHITGYIHSSELFRNPKEWRAHLRQLPFVPETMAAQRLMKIFLQQKKSLAIVIDEFGGTSGLVSLEDIVEEIFGEIEDEHDNTKYVAAQISETEYLLSARLEIDKVNDMFGLSLPESDEYMTVSGLILHEFQSFPKLNEIVTIGDFEFKIIKNTMTKIELVRLKTKE
ncbi:MAG: hemolysin family protein [Prevotella sp.]|nr:hemolysin family protein [Prevotellaceae bacterium]MDY3936711.1 hemolysin family protein [Prevotella sp.]